MTNSYISPLCCFCLVLGFLLCFHMTALKSLFSRLHLSVARAAAPREKDSVVQGIDSQLGL